MKVNYDNLRTGDIVCTTGRGFFGRVISRITGSRTTRSDKATHVGIVVRWGGQCFIAEMLTKGLEINTFRRYTEKKRRWILEVNRPVNLTLSKRNKVLEAVSKDYEEGLSYDYRGVLSFLIPKIQEVPSKFFCSEYIAHLLEHEAGLDLAWEWSRYAPTDFQIDSKHVDMESVKWIL